MAKTKKVATKKKAVAKKTKPAKAKKVAKPVTKKTPDTPEIKKDDGKKPRVGYLKRDRTKYELNGSGEKLGKGKFVLQLVKQVLERKPQTTFDELGKIFPPELQKGYKGVFQKTSDVKKNELTKRYFMDNDQLLKTGDGVSISIVREFGAGNISAVIEVAKKLGFKVKEHRAE